MYVQNETRTLWCTLLLGWRNLGGACPKRGGTAMVGPNQSGINAGCLTAPVCVKLGIGGCGAGMGLDMPCAAGLRRQLPGHTTATLGSWAKLAAKSHFPARPEGQSNDCERKSTWPKKNRHRHAEVKFRCEIVPATLLSRSCLRHRSVNPCARQRATVSLLASRQALRTAR